MPTKEVVKYYLSMHLNITEISLPFFFGREVYTHYTTLHSDTQTLIHSRILRALLTPPLTTILLPHKKG